MPILVCPLASALIVTMTLVFLSGRLAANTALWSVWDATAPDPRRAT
jgi:hypothetical protein